MSLAAHASMASSISRRVARQLLTPSAFHLGLPGAWRRPPYRCGSLQALLGGDFGARGLADEAGKHEAMNGLPEAHRSLVEESATEEGCEDPEARVARRRAAGLELRSLMEEAMGPERTALTVLVAKHGVILRGGAKEGKAFIEALMQWKAEEVLKDSGEK
mmetsp:Transcript_12074/g.19476  ORF Transcript_12074/g.19476 Transcript_12074/m.19476 type:complete len:161 (-) Transcript_12074:472-954(-)